MPRPARTFLDTAVQIESLLDAAGELDRGARLREGHARPLLALLVFTGLRLGETLSLRWRDVDLANSVIRVRASKTEAGLRQVDILPPLADELGTLKARRGGARDAYVFATSTGSAEQPSNVRRRMLAPAVTRANERLDQIGEELIPTGLTPHSLRRTYATLLLALNVPLPTAMDLLGHATERMTVGVYAQGARRRDGELQRLRDLVTGGDDTALNALLSTGPDRRAPVG